ncbi:hypothetical protein GEMRC1_006515 [Eukaryota sp. GEM-RC1]
MYPLSVVLYRSFVTLIFTPVFFFLVFLLCALDQDTFAEWSPNICGYVCVMSVFVFNLLFDPSILNWFAQKKFYRAPKRFLLCCSAIVFLLGYILNGAETLFLKLFLHLSYRPHLHVTWHQVICFFLFGFNTVLFGNRLLNAKPGRQTVFSLYILTLVIWASTSSYDISFIIPRSAALVQSFIVVQLAALTSFRDHCEKKYERVGSFSRFSSFFPWYVLIGSAVYFIFTFLFIYLVFPSESFDSVIGHVWGTLTFAGFLL